MAFPRILSLLIVLGVALGQRLPAEGGLWTFSAPPRAELLAGHGFELTPAWLDHLQRSSVGFGTASGSFVSSDGLVLTNHHVGRSAAQRVSTAEKNYIRDGFHATKLEAEIPVPDLELRVLESITDVTARVNAAIPAGASNEAAAEARRQAFTAIETESLAQTGLKGNVVTLYKGAQYHLYRYRTYTDVRLVFAPESAIAAFGGDADNFEYPRYCLDFMLFRVYEDGRPAQIAHYLRWAQKGVQAGDLIFVSGQPGRTDRLLTLAELAYMRDSVLPRRLAQLVRSEIVLTTWGARDAENLRRTGRVLPGIQNNRKRTIGQLAALQDPTFLGRLAAAEADFKAQLHARGEREALAAFDRIASAQETLRGLAVRHGMLEGAGGFAGSSFTFARDLLRVGDETLKPNGERLREYTNARRASFERTLFSPSPVHEDLEIVRLTDALGTLIEQLGATDATVQAVLAGKSARDRAVELIRGTRVRDLAFRRQLYAGGAAAVAAAQDPMIELARLIDAESRALRRAVETQGEIVEQAHAAISRARFALGGANQPPDATGTLRLSYGVVQGYEEDGVAVPFRTFAAGLFERNSAHQDRPPFNLPESWRTARDRIDPGLPFNFVATCDTVGGNSGSPAVNRAGELVGLVFDGNIQSLAGNFAFSDRQSRSIFVAPEIIVAALRHVYGADALADELVNGHR